MCCGKKCQILSVRISSQLAAQLVCDLFIEVLKFQSSRETGWLAEPLCKCSFLHLSSHYLFLTALSRAQRIGNNAKEEQLLFCPSNCAVLSPGHINGRTRLQAIHERIHFIGAQLEHLPTAYKAPRAAAHSGQYGFCSLSSSTPPLSLLVSHILAQNLHSKMVSFDILLSPNHYLVNIVACGWNYLIFKRELKIEYYNGARNSGGFWNNS